MAEYIEREAALAFQNEVEPLLCRNVVTHDIMSATKDADMVKYLQSLPAADVRPVVVCVNCKYDNHCLTQAFVEEASKIPFDRNTFFCADGKKADDA